MFKVLIVEDDRALRQLFSRVLMNNGYTAKGVSNGQEALDALDSDYYDLIISDIMMPVMDGYELVRQLRDSGNTTPVMMITAKDAFDDMRLGFLSGTDDYMVKPVNVNEMVLRVGALLRRAQMSMTARLRLAIPFWTATLLRSPRRERARFSRRKNLCCSTNWHRFPAGFLPVSSLWMKSGGTTARATPTPLMCISAD